MMEINPDLQKSVIQQAFNEPHFLGLIASYLDEYNEGAFKFLLAGTRRDAGEYIGVRKLIIELSKLTPMDAMRYLKAAAGVQSFTIILDSMSNQWDPSSSLSSKNYPHEDAVRKLLLSIIENIKNVISVTFTGKKQQNNHLKEWINKFVFEACHILTKNIHEFSLVDIELTDKTTVRIKEYVSSLKMLNRFGLLGPIFETQKEKMKLVDNAFSSSELPKREMSIVMDDSWKGCLHTIKTDIIVLRFLENNGRLAPDGIHSWLDGWTCDKGVQKVIFEFEEPQDNTLVSRIQYSHPKREYLS